MNRIGRKRVLPRLAWCCGLFVWASLSLGGEAACEPTPQGPRRLPQLSEESSVGEVTGRIASSTRGRPGPVRLVLELKDGSSLAVLVAPDALCESLGLALQPGETITVVGQEVKGSRPLFVTQAVVSGDRRIAVRDAQGRWLPAPSPSAAAPAPSEELPKGE